MSILFQQILIGVAVAFAAAYLVRFYLRRGKKEGACGSCRLMHVAGKARRLNS